MNQGKPDCSELFQRIAKLSADADWTQEETVAFLRESGISPDNVANRVLDQLRGFNRTLNTHDGDRAEVQTAIRPEYGADNAIRAESNVKRLIPQDSGKLSTRDQLEYAMASTLSPGWLKARIILDLVGRTLLPLAAVFVIMFYSGKQESLRNLDAAHELDLGVSQSFHQNITSEDPTRRSQAITIFRAMNSRLAAMLAPVAATVDPIAATNRSVDIAADRSEDAQTRSTAEESRRQIMMDFKIDEPSYGASVDLSQVVRGTTPFHGMHHYIVVQTPQGEELVVGEARLSGNSWEGIARFGQAGAGAHEQFHVRVIATKFTLSGVPFQEPADAMSSDSIAVKRRD